MSIVVFYEIIYIHSQILCNAFKCLTFLYYINRMLFHFCLKVK